MQPLKIFKSGERELTVEWDDRHYGRHTYKTLRKLCPCAICRMDREKNNKVMSDESSNIVNIEQVGLYAIKIYWDDGHNTGIYTYDYLRNICECSNCEMVRENLNL